MVEPALPAALVRLGRDVHNHIGVGGSQVHGDAGLFAADDAAIKTVHRRGVPVVQNGRHVARDELSARYAKVLAGFT